MPISDGALVAALLIALCAFVTMSCTSPSHDGVQGHLRASLPVEGTLVFE